MCVRTSSCQCLAEKGCLEPRGRGREEHGSHSSTHLLLNTEVVTRPLSTMSVPDFPSPLHSLLTYRSQTGSSRSGQLESLLRRGSRVPGSIIAGSQSTLETPYLQRELTPLSTIRILFPHREEGIPRWVVVPYTWQSRGWYRCLYQRLFHAPASVLRPCLCLGWFS